MKILYINESPEVHERYLKGDIPSHWFYGAIEMEKDGHDVYWCKENTGFFYDLKLIKKYKPEIIFIPNLNMKSHLLLFLMKKLSLINIPIYAYLHHAPTHGSLLKTYIYKRFLPLSNHIFFLSYKTMYETIKGGFINEQKCSVPGWGPDMDFYNRVKTSDKGYFISTGKENRDFDILIEAFKRTGEPLKIMTAKSHAGIKYDNLIEKCKNIPNIEVIITENSSSVYPQMLSAMANAKAIVCPLLKNKLTYCVGLSTITDAEGLHKPLIITRNPYHEANRMQEFNLVENIDDWVYAIKHIKTKSSADIYSMKKAYLHIKQYMNL